VNELPVIVHRRIDRQAVLGAEVIIVQPWPGAMWTNPCLVDCPQTWSPAKNFPVRLQKELVFEFAQVPAVEAANDLIILPAAFFSPRSAAREGNDVMLLADEHERSS